MPTIAGFWGHRGGLRDTKKICDFLGVVIVTTATNA